MFVIYFLHFTSLCESECDNTLGISPFSPMPQKDTDTSRVCYNNSSHPSPSSGLLVFNSLQSGLAGSEILREKMLKLGCTSPWWRANESSLIRIIRCCIVTFKLKETLTFFFCFCVFLVCSSSELKSCSTRGNILCLGETASSRLSTEKYAKSTGLANIEKNINTTENFNTARECCRFMTVYIASLRLYVIS